MCFQQEDLLGENSKGTDIVVLCRNQEGLDGDS